MARTQPSFRRRVMVFGGTGTIGRATLAALAARGHDVVAFQRLRRGDRADTVARLPQGVHPWFGEVTDPAALRAAFAQGTCDAVVSCLASRTGAPRDAWAIDHGAQSAILSAAKEAGVAQMVLLSAICVQKPTLEFQKAKLAFEAELRASGLDWSIVRPTAFFKSLSGQVARVAAGKPYLLFGDGALTACKPISDRDLAEYLADCLDDPALRNRVLPIGGPGPAITPREQGEALFALLGRKPEFRHVSPRLMSVVAGALGLLGLVSGRARDKAELARIGRYYATESMLVLDPATGRYSAEATPSTGSDRLVDHYAKLLRGEVSADLGDHAVF